ncbi:Wzz/FepE/Etk N-terminal domain-containing protein [Sandaracinobacter sp. RS1-74]|uniref:Wzz/FepE/Etk N-terminal domain-containing protein n=1 Tax=Sandaracinobacteroides sayramensis TaxID=2913411 RepID=UPI001EDA7CD2|nr:Wzz/FepE/Etk N-terminal domain-containing protein [Sandaracinobacteroides sayramensis]MCG2840234.1 Wzz/FepE/Etk N-terminal domain-containing protein [Sandaracinobacteroides sayramensis]
MSLIQFLRILLARWKMILGTALACTLVASTIAMLLPKRYPATARVLLEIGRPDPVTGEVVSGRDRGYVRTQVELIKDMRVAGQVVDRLGLASAPGSIAAYEATGRTEADGGIRAWLGQQIINNTDAGVVSGSSILQISYQSSDPERAKQVVGLLREAYIDQSLRFRTDAAGRSGEWYREQAEKAREALAASERELAAFMGQNEIVVVNGMDSESAKLAALQASLQQARGMQSSTDAAVAGRLANDPVADQLQVQLATIEDELALAGARLGAQHPSYKALQARRNTVANQLAQARSKSQQGVSALAGAANRSVAQLETQVAQQEKVVLQRKPVLDEFIRLNREVELKRQQYERASARTDELLLQADVSEAGLVMLGDPVASRTPSYPKVNLIVGLAAFFGLALGTLAAIIAEFIARRVRGYEDLAYAAGVPVLVTVGSSKPSPLRSRLHKLLGRRDRSGGEGEPQAI